MEMSWGVISVCFGGFLINLMEINVGFFCGSNLILREIV
jgi:hypothetical protein